MQDEIAYIIILHTFTLLHSIHPTRKASGLGRLSSHALHISQEIKANIASQRQRLMPSSPQELKSNGKNKQIENFQLLLYASTEEQITTLFA